jgi:hypothetical protein
VLPQPQFSKPIHNRGFGFIDLGQLANRFGGHRRIVIAYQFFLLGGQSGIRSSLRHMIYKLALFFGISL